LNMLFDLCFSSSQSLIRATTLALALAIAVYLNHAARGQSGDSIVTPFADRWPQQGMNTRHNSAPAERLSKEPVPLAPPPTLVPPLPSWREVVYPHIVRHCHGHHRKQPEKMRALAVSQISLQTECKCVAGRIIASMTDADFNVMEQNFHRVGLYLLPKFVDLFQGARGFCAAGWQGVGQGQARTTSCFNSPVNCRVTPAFIQVP
jgi:hypothetical protein